MRGLGAIWHEMLLALRRLSPRGRACTLAGYIAVVSPFLWKINGGGPGFGFEITLSTIFLFGTALWVLSMLRFYLCYDIIVASSHPKSYFRSTIKPPINAEFIFYLFMASQNCDALVGDLEERYKLIHKKFGRRRANFWYWTQTMISLAPIVWAWAKGVGMKPVAAFVAWAVARGILGEHSWLVPLVDLWKRMRS